MTEFVFRLHPIPGTALMADLTSDAADAIGPMQRWRDLLTEAPRPATLHSSVKTDAGGRPVVKDCQPYQGCAEVWGPFPSLLLGACYWASTPGDATDIPASRAASASRRS